MSRGYPLTCTTQSQYDTQLCIMKHLLFLNTQEPSVERPSPSNIGLRRGYYSHQEQYSTKRKQSKTDLLSAEIVASVLHVYRIMSLTHI